MTPTTLKEDLEGLIANLDLEWEDAKAQLKAGKSVVANYKRLLTNTRTKKAEAERALALLYPPAPEPRVWESVYDIPPGTAVSTPSSVLTLNVLSDGTGWWSDPGKHPGLNSHGWKLRATSVKAPFTEIVKESK